MTNQELEQLRYPIGKFKIPQLITNLHLQEWIDILETFPDKLETLVKDFNDHLLNIPYRPEGWTIRQVVHHLADSHHHSYIRFKWALTEDTPIIKPYDEQSWAELPDSKEAPIQMSLDHLKAVHFKLVYLLKRLSDDELNKSFIHPEHNNDISLKRNIAMYAWHSEHHYAHIKNLLDRS